MLSRFKKVKHNPYKDDEIYAMADALQIPIETVNDEMFSKKMLGEGIAFVLKEGRICSPVNGELTVLYPSGHAFGITMNNGVGLLCHIGINTVNANGKGFSILAKQGDKVKVGDAIVEVDLKYLKPSYDLTTMLIVSEPNNKNIIFQEPTTVEQGMRIGCIK